MRFRPARAADRDAIIALHVAISRQAYAEILSADYLRDVLPQEKADLWTRRFAALGEGVQITVAEDGEVAGFLCFDLTQEAEFGSYLHNLYVAPAYRGAGHARALIRHGLRRFDAGRMAMPVHLVAFTQNLPACGLYDALGGQVVQRMVGTRPGSPPADLVRYRWDSALLLERAVAKG